MSAQIRRLSSADAGFTATLDALLAFEGSTDAAIEQAVADILQAVRRDGDQAVVEFTRRFDHLDVADMAALELPRAELEAALAGLGAEQRQALEAAAERVRSYHARQVQESWQYEDEAPGMAGTRLGQKVTPLDRVGLYVPGGRASYPSSVLMNAIPAKVAGVGELIMVVPTPRGEKNPLVLAAAAITGVDRVFTIGGAQAVAALAYGTATIPQVDKIVGPGNAYVASAKRRVFGTVGIDMVAGPSEVLIISDGSGNPDWVAMDLFAQAEHDDLAQSILLCTDAAFIARVEESIARLMPEMPRRETIATSLEEPGCADPGAGSGRGLRHRQPHRAGAPGAVPGRAGPVDGPHPPRWRHLHRSPLGGGPGGLLCRPQPRAAHHAQRALLQPPGGLRLPEAHQPDRRIRSRCPDPGPHCFGAGPRRRPAGPCSLGGDAVEALIRRLSVGSRSFGLEPVNPYGRLSGV
jgi:histidinol dehydrogenase